MFNEFTFVQKPKDLSEIIARFKNLLQQRQKVDEMFAQPVVSHWATVIMVCSGGCENDKEHVRELSTVPYAHAL
jgi:hypothetical protein